MKAGKDRLSTRLLLDDGAPVTLWDEEGAGEGAKGMAIVETLCLNSECECTDVTLDVWSIDKRLAGLEVRDRKTIITYKPAGKDDAPHPQGCLKVVVDVAAGTYSVTKQNSAAGEEGLPELFDKQFKQILLEILRKRWRSTRRVYRERWREKDWSWWEPGEMVAWSDVFPDDPNLLFLSEGRPCLATDHYCVTPGCSCRDAMISFVEIHGDNRDDPPSHLGAIRVKISSLRISLSDIEDVSPGFSRAGLEQLWKDFRKIPGLRSTLSSRRKELRSIGKDLHNLREGGSLPAPLSKKKMGRNDPCSCGSGKKYKKCCGR
jgi:hypothetical protein